MASIALLWALGASGCAAGGSSTATPAPNESAVPSSSAAASPAAPAPSPSPSASAGDEPVVLDSTEWGALVAECVSASMPDQPLTVVEDSALVVRRPVTPEWFVYVPAETEETEGGYLCTLSGAKDAPVVESWGTSLRPSGDELQRWLTTNDNEGL
ncbi:hypothetical protein Q9S78_12150 [Microbacterium sp. KSW-18]|uniref:Ig-like domain-containing protein n=1 Tax=Microbacterium aquilitoris TaxID=3067307 RepID=A0ABU3GL38_9MICO|nr:hypothetical protein [Microbacterium sp. KSW-18]MDT3331419.1 hypothetical protein [Microbacterium sp. KSW-18]